MAVQIDPATLSPSGWWAASSLSGNDGDVLTTWADSSGNGRDLTQGTSGYRPRLRKNIWNGQQAVRFDGTDDYLYTGVNISVLLGTDGLGTILVIAREIESAPTAAKALLGTASASETVRLSLRADLSPKVFESIHTDAGGELLAQLPAPLDTLGPGSVPYVLCTFTGYAFGNVPRVLLWIHDTVTAKQYLGVDNLDDAALAFGTVGASVGTANPLWIGRSHAGNFWNGDIFEVIVFPTALSEEQRRGVCLWLTEKYGLKYESGIARETPGPSPELKVEMALPAEELVLEPSLWFKADAITGLSDSDPVTTWEDSSENGYDAAQGTDHYRPLYKTGQVNGLPAVLFDGGDDYLDLGSVTLGNVIGFDGWGTVFGVVKGVAGGATEQAFWLADPMGSADVFLGVNGTNARAGNYDGSADTVDTAWNPVGGDWGILIWEHGSNTPDFSPTYLYIGVDDTTSWVSVASGTTSAARLAAGVWVGGGSAKPWKGYVAELIAFPWGLDARQRVSVLQYLAMKYGLSAPTLTGYAAPWRTSWIDVTSDVQAGNGLKLTSGMTSTDVTDRVAPAGQLELSLNNSTKNSAGLLGYYSPEHPNCRNGFQIGTAIRVSWKLYGTQYYKWQGWISQISVVPGRQAGYASVRIQATDWMDFAGRTTLAQLPVRTDYDAGKLFFNLYDNSSRKPYTIWLEKGSEQYAFAFDSADDEGILILSEMNRLTRSELGFAYIRGNVGGRVGGNTGAHIFGGGTLVFRARGRTAETAPIVRWAMTDVDDIRNLALQEHNLDGIVNRVLVELHPRRIDTVTTTVLFTLYSTLAIGASETAPFVAPYRDPASGRYVRVGGTDMTTPVSGTDYLFYQNEDGTGTNYTANLSVTVTFGANSAAVSITNNGPAGYLTKFQLRGRGLYSDESVIVDKKDTESIQEYGQMQVHLDMPYQDNIALGTQAADHILILYKTPHTHVKEVNFLANNSTVSMMHTLSRDIGDRVSVTETVSGLSAKEYFIHGLEIVAGGDGSFLAVRWTLLPAALEDWSDWAPMPPD